MKKLSLLFLTGVMALSTIACGDKKKEETKLDVIIEETVENEIKSDEENAVESKEDLESLPQEDVDVSMKEWINDATENAFVNPIDELEGLTLAEAEELGYTFGWATYIDEELLYISASVDLESKNFEYLLKEFENITFSELINKYNASIIYSGGNELEVLCGSTTIIFDLEHVDDIISFYNENEEMDYFERLEKIKNMESIQNDVLKNIQLTRMEIHVQLDDESLLKIEEPIKNGIFDGMYMDEHANELRIEKAGYPSLVNNKY